MKRYLILLFALAISLTSFGQIDETNNIVRNNTLSPARVANALDIMKVWSTSGTDTYAISVTVGSHSPYAGGLTYTTGDIFKVKFGNTNTSGTTSLNVNTDGAIPLKDAEGNNFGIGDLAANSIHAFYYDGTNFREISGSGGGAGGTWGSITGTLSSQTDLQSALDAKQDDLVSGTNIKTVNGSSIVGSGDLDLIDDAIVNGEAKAPSQNAVYDANALKADLASPTFTGTPSAPTAATTTNTTQLATTAFVQQEIDARVEVYVVPFADETTPLTASANKRTFHWPYSTTTITAVWVGLTTVQSSGSILTIDVHKNGTTILSTKVTVDNGEDTSLIPATPPVISVPSITEGDKVTIDIDQIGDGTATGGKLYIKYTRP
jgi:hypothetical protein